MAGFCVVSVTKEDANEVVLSEMGLGSDDRLVSSACGEGMAV